MKTLILGILLALSSPLLANDKPVVLVTMPPFEFYVKKIAGDLVTTTSIIPMNANAHLYEPTPQAMERMASSAIWFQMGEPIEEKVRKALALYNENIIRVDLKEGLDLLPSLCHAGRGKKTHCPHQDDLHFWLSLELARHFSTTMALTLMEILPDSHTLLRDNLNSLLGELFALEKHYQERLAPCKGESVLVTHPAFAYFLTPHEIRELPIEITGKEPTLAQVNALVKKAQDEKVKVVILELGHSTKAAELIARRLNLPTCTINPLDKEVFQTMEQLANCICP